MTDIHFTLGGSHANSFESVDPPEVEEAQLASNLVEANLIEVKSRVARPLGESEFGEAAFDFQVGGSLDSDATSYVSRRADTLFYEALRAGQFCYVLNSRQMGKSSLRVRAMQRLQSEGFVCVFIDLTGMGTQEVTPEKWYAGIVQCFVSNCQLSAVVDWRVWWKERRELLSPVQRLQLFLKEVVLPYISQPIVVFVDEIDRVLSQTFSLDDFFALIQGLSEQHLTIPTGAATAADRAEKTHPHLTFALLGVATPCDLIRDKSQTPLNVGQAIQLQGFRLDEASPLTKGLRGWVSCPEAVMEEILGWTGGQPFLTQKLCCLVVRAVRQSQPEGLRLAHSAGEPFGTQAEVGRSEVKAFVAQVVRSHLLENWQAQDEPEHLRTIQNRILRSENRAGRLLGLYQRILQEDLEADGSAEQMELRLSGLVVEHQGKLRVYNRIYAAVFNEAWVQRKLAELRPYAEAIAVWMASNGQNEAALLRGQTLQDVLSWSLGKSLGDGDYQFIVASQKLAQRQAQTALKSATLASKLLASARHNAQQEAVQGRIKWAWLPSVSLAITLALWGVRWCGGFQGLEWTLLDQFFRGRSPAATDPRIAIVTIDETDIRQVGQWPIPDQVLAEAISTIKAQQPQAIGLDLYRDLPVAPGHQAFVRVAQTTPNLFGVEKLVENAIAAPPILKQQNQVGFADQVVDADGRVRRALLTLSLGQNDLHQSLGSLMALHYLSAKNIAVEQGTDSQIRLGKTLIRRFEGNDGGYVRADSGGYQILLNYHGTERHFATVPLRDVLAQKLPPDSLRDRLVFIGTTAESLNDFFLTPFGQGLWGAPVRVSGVAIHANIASNLLSAALDGRSPLRVWPKPLEGLWILVWAGTGAAIGLYFRSPLSAAAVAVLGSGSLFSLCYAAFLLSWWLPCVPAWVALAGGAVTVQIIRNRQQDQVLFECTLANLQDMGRDYPIASQIALEYFKQSEPQGRQSIISQCLAPKDLP
ncbi:MAG: CHASE2 domain-containing protein [Thermosynechococcaceae cyanobacterium MS004]|nr:CHASE2 domain-containing protein [Thermosynechococcaceae cyanobacterium MS004]